MTIQARTTDAHRPVRRVAHTAIGEMTGIVATIAVDQGIGLVTDPEIGHGKNQGTDLDLETGMTSTKEGRLNKKRSSG